MNSYIKFSIPSLLILILLFFGKQTAYGQKYKPGFIIDDDGTIIHGEIRVYSSKNKPVDFTLGREIETESAGIKFRKDGEVKDYGIKGISGFVIGKDSFSIVNNFYISRKTYVTRDFAKVIESGEINLFQHLSFGSPSYNNSFSAGSGGIAMGFGSGGSFDRLVICNNNGVICSAVYQIKKRRKVIAEYFRQDPELYRELKESKWEIDDLKGFVHQYNAKRVNREE